MQNKDAFSFTVMAAKSQLKLVLRSRQPY